MGFCDGTTPAIERDWDSADLFVENTEDCYHFGIWDPTEETLGHAVVQSWHPYGRESRNTLFTEIAHCVTFERDTAIGRILLPVMGMSVSMSGEDPTTGINTAEMRFALTRQTVDATDILNDSLPAQHRLGAIREDIKPKQTTVDLASGLAEDEPTLIIGTTSIYRAHDRVAHQSLWESLSPRTRCAIRDLSRATLAGEVPFDPLQEVGGSDPVMQLVDRFDFNTVFRRIPAAVLERSQPSRAHMLPRALGTILGMPPEEAQAHANDTLEHVAYLTNHLTNSNATTAALRLYPKD